VAARPVWSGHLKLSHVSVPVKAYSAGATGGEIHLNQLHAGCNARVQYKKNCPIHGELQSDQIVSGYEHAKGQYVVIEPDELDKLRTENDKALKIDTFVDEDRIDSLYLSGQA
jgi:DNA end-binding protein Ku